MKNNSGVTPAGQCGTWVKEPDGGYFTSPNYPEKYPPERECIYIIEGEAFIFFFLASYSLATPPSLPPLLLFFTCFQPVFLLQPLPDSALTCSLMRSTPSSRPGSVSSTTSRSVMGPSVSRPSLAAIVDRKALHMFAPVEGTFTSSLWPMVNSRPSVSLHGITSHKVSGGSYVLSICRGLNFWSFNIVKSRKTLFGLATSLFWLFWSQPCFQQQQHFVVIKL